MLLHKFKNFRIVFHCVGILLFLIHLPMDGHLDGFQLTFKKTACFLTWLDKRVPVAPYLCHHLVPQICLILPTLLGVYRLYLYCILVLLCVKVSFCRHLLLSPWFTFWLQSFVLSELPLSSACDLGGAVRPWLDQSEYSISPGHSDCCLWPK